MALRQSGQVDTPSTGTPVSTPSNDIISIPDSSSKEEGDTDEEMDEPSQTPKVKKPTEPKAATSRQKGKGQGPKIDPSVMEELEFAISSLEQLRRNIASDNATIKGELKDVRKDNSSCIKNVNDRLAEMDSRMEEFGDRIDTSLQSVDDRLSAWTKVYNRRIDRANSNNAILHSALMVATGGTRLTGWMDDIASDVEGESPPPEQIPSPTLPASDGSSEGYQESVHPKQGYMELPKTQTRASTSKTARSEDVGTSGVVNLDEKKRKRQAEKDRGGEAKKKRLE